MVEKQKQHIPEDISSVPGQTQREHPGVEQEMHPQPIYIDPAYRGAGKLEGKKALITGGDSGIGRSVAVLFAREGADVLVNYLDEREDKDAKETKRLVEQEGRRCVLVRGDLSNSGFCRELMDRMISEFGRIDILVNNASVQYVCDDLTKLTDEQLHNTFSSNIFSMIYLTREALKHMQEGSTILFSTSVNAFRGHPTLIDYTATKGAILALSRSLAANLASRNIRVNAVAPGMLLIVEIQPNPALYNSYLEIHCKNRAYMDASNSKLFRRRESGPIRSEDSSGPTWPAI